MKNIILACSVFLFSLASCQSTGATASVNDMENVDFTDNSQVLIDVRTPEEFAEGHLPNAINIDVKSDNFASEIQALDQDKTYYIYCKSGMRSTHAVQQFEQAGFEHLVNLKDGYSAYKK